MVAQSTLFVWIPVAVAWVARCRAAFQDTPQVQGRAGLSLHEYKIDSGAQGKKLSISVARVFYGGCDQEFKCCVLRKTLGGFPIGECVIFQISWV